MHRTESAKNDAECVKAANSAPSGEHGRTENLTMPNPRSVHEIQSQIAGEQKCIGIVKHFVGLRESYPTNMCRRFSTFHHYWLPVSPRTISKSSEQLSPRICLRVFIGAILSLAHCCRRAITLRVVVYEPYNRKKTSVYHTVNGDLHCFTHRKQQK